MTMGFYYSIFCDLVICGCSVYGCYALVYMDIDRVQTAYVNNNEVFRLSKRRLGSLAPVARDLRHPKRKQLRSAKHFSYENQRNNGMWGKRVGSGT